MKRLALAVLCLCLVFMALTPLPAAAQDCQEGCCSDAQQMAQADCWYSYVTHFWCMEGYMGSCCAAGWSCAPPPI